MTAGGELTGEGQSVSVRPMDSHGCRPLPLVSDAMWVHPTPVSSPSPMTHPNRLSSSRAGGQVIGHGLALGEEVEDLALVRGNCGAGHRGKDAR